MSQVPVRLIFTSSEKSIMNTFANLLEISFVSSWLKTNCLKTYTDSVLDGLFELFFVTGFVDQGLCCQECYWPRAELESENLA